MVYKIQKIICNLKTNKLFYYQKHSILRNKNWVFFVNNLNYKYPRRFYLNIPV